MNGQWPIIPLPPKIIPSSQPHLHQISRPSNPPASTCCLLRRTVALVMPTCYVASASALVRIAWRSSCGPPTGGALGSCRCRPPARPTAPAARFGFRCTEALVVTLLPVARWALLPPARADMRQSPPQNAGHGASGRVPASAWSCRCTNLRGIRPRGCACIMAGSSGRASLDCEYVAAARRIQR